MPRVDQRVDFKGEIFRTQALCATIIIVPVAFMAQLARMFEAYLITLERQAARLENVASKLENEDQRATVLDSVAVLRKEVRALREQIKLLVEWG